jgi:peptidyl-dipeptidase Dcp
MSSFRTQEKFDGVVSPHVLNVMSIPKAPEGQPTTVSFDDATTMLHELGHALHGLLSDVNYPAIAGTAVPRDFVEFPSQVNEMWATWPEVVTSYAVHHETGEPMPAELVERVLAIETFNQGFATTEYLAASITDQAIHRLAPEDVPSGDELMRYEAEVLEAAGANVAAVPPRYHFPYFSHIFGGYAAGYYSYIWSEVLDADSQAWFEEHGGLTRANGDHFRRTLLSRGGSVDAMQLFRTFAGREPRIGPLLEKRGLTAAPAN